jgi:hypothetical protein
VITVNQGVRGGPRWQINWIEEKNSSW